MYYTFKLKREFDNFVRKVLCDPMANRPHTYVLGEKGECYIGIHNSQE